MSSFLTNGSSYGSVSDPKFPPSEVYSQGNYIPDYYAGHNAAAVANSAISQANQVSVHHHHQGHHHPHYSYQHPIYGSSLQQDSSSLGLNSYGHHPSHSSSLHGHLPTQSYYNPCTGSVVHSSHPSSHLSGQHVLSTHQPISSLSSLSVGNTSSGSVRIPSPPSLHRTPSPRNIGQNAHHSLSVQPHLNTLSRIRPENISSVTSSSNGDNVNFKSESRSSRSPSFSSESSDKNSLEMTSPASGGQSNNIQRKNKTSTNEGDQQQSKTYFPWMKSYSGNKAWSHKNPRSQKTRKSTFKKLAVAWICFEKRYATKEIMQKDRQSVTTKQRDNWSGEQWSKMLLMIFLIWSIAWMNGSN